MSEDLEKVNVRKHVETAERHRYTVALRFSGVHLMPSHISAQLGLRPSHVSSEGQNSSGKGRRQAFWSYDGQGEAGYHPEWACLESGLAFLVKHLARKKADIIALHQRFPGVWWCGHFQTSFNGGPSLSPELMTALGSFGIPLSIDNYFSEEEIIEEVQE